MFHLHAGYTESVKVRGRKTCKRYFTFIDKRNAEMGVAFFWDMTRRQWIPTFREDGVILTGRQALEK